VSRPSALFARESRDPEPPGQRSWPWVPGLAALARDTERRACGRCLHHDGAGVVELLDRAPPPYPRAPLVAIDRGAVPDGVGRAQRLDGGLAACAPRAHEIDLRLGDPARQGDAVVVRTVAGDPAGQRLDLVVAGGIAHRRAQAMAPGVLRRARLAGGGARPGAAAGIAAVGVQPARADRAPAVARCVCSAASSPIAAGAPCVMHLQCHCHDQRPRLRRDHRPAPSPWARGARACADQECGFRDDDLVYISPVTSSTSFCRHFRGRHAVEAARATHEAVFAPQW
jgi:hypothetical protein